MSSLLGSNSTISVKRLQNVSDKYDYPTGDIYTDIPAYIERLDPNVAAILDSPAVFETYNCFIPEGFDVRIKDQVTDNRGNIYNVRGVSVFEDNTEIGSMSNHTELIIVKQYE